MKLISITINENGLHVQHDNEIDINKPAWLINKERKELAIFVLFGWACKLQEEINEEMNEAIFGIDNNTLDR